MAAHESCGKHTYTVHTHTIRRRTIALQPNTEPLGQKDGHSQLSVTTKPRVPSTRAIVSRASLWSLRGGAPAGDGP